MAKTRRTSSLGRRRSAAIRSIRKGMTWEELEHHIDTDPCFDVHTANGKYWVDPFTGKRAQAANNRAAALRHYFKSYEHWKKYPVKGMQELQFWRWVHYLQESIRTEPRLRFFRADGAWLNPYVGTWDSSVRRIEGRITSLTIHEMAKVLAISVEPGPADPLAFPELRAIIEDSHNKPPSSDGGKSSTPAADNGPDTDVVEASIDDGSETATDEAGQASEEPKEAPAEQTPESNPIMDVAGEESRPRTGIHTARARKVQSQLLGDLPEVEGFDIAVAYRPCEKVSGDFYDVVQIDQDNVLMVLGDVTGHGVQAALTMASALKTLRFVARGKQDIVDTLVELNDEVKGDLLPDQFITMAAVWINLNDHTMTIANAGHHASAIANFEDEPLLRRVHGKGAAIGMAKGSTIRSSYQTTTVQLRPHDVVLMYTDGLSEAMNAYEEEFGDMRVLGCLIAHLDGSDLLEVVGSMIEDVIGWTNGQPADDLTIFAFQVLPDAAD